MARTPLRGMRAGQAVASLALAILAIIALVAVLSGCGAASKSASASDAGTSRAADAPGSPSSRAGHQARSSHSSDQAQGAQQGAASGGLTAVPLASLPSQARDTVKLIDAGGPFPYSRDGVVFGNYEKALPVQARGWYHEYTVPTPGASNRGARRIITGKDASLFYTANHYQTFVKVIR